MKPLRPTPRSIQYVVRLGSHERAQLEAIHAHEQKRRGTSGASLTIAEALRIVIAEAAKKRDCEPERAAWGRDDDSGVRVEVRRGSGKPARSRGS